MLEWKQILRTNFTKLEPLVEFLQLNNDQKSSILTNPNFVLNLPLRLAQKIEKRTLNDPILKQFLPSKEENNIYSDFTLDPLKDRTFLCSSKLLHKYQGRVLLLCTSACAMHCRYCFRQNFPYESQIKDFNNEIEYISNDASIHEVILSGGDPLSLSDHILHELLKRLSSIRHIKKIRFHTRFPIGIPERINTSLLDILKELRPQIYFVIHCNHPNELDETIFKHLKSLQNLGIPVLNQAVLLSGVNDDVTTLTNLCEILSDNGVLPYYLHQLDRVQGAAHFEVTEQKGQWLMQEITKKLPGHAVPKYVREIAGQPNKSSLF